jgi:septum site-determining protein MinC
MEPELISIAGTNRTTDNPLPAEVIGQPAQIRLDAERLVYEPLA